MDFEQFYQDKYPAGIPREVDLKKYKNMVDVFEQAVKKFADKPAFTAVGVTLTYRDLDTQSRNFAAWLQNKTDLKPGDRIAVQMPNITQYPVIVFGAMRAGLIVVNTNPLYTTREMEHQFNDSGAKALVVLANMADNAEKVLPHTGIEHVIVTEIADMHSPIKRTLMNAVVKHVKKMVPSYNLPTAHKLPAVLSAGAREKFTPVDINLDDLAVLQYTGGTTGVAKGAMLTHANLVANLTQVRPMMEDQVEEGKEVVIAPLPLYHIYSFTLNCGIMLEAGAHNVLIPNPRDIPGFVKEMQKQKFSAFIGLNTLFVALCNNEDFQDLDFSGLKLTASGGMALTSDTAKMWERVTGCEISEGYGMTETSPVVTFNPRSAIQIGTIGLPIPSTVVKTIDDDGNETPIGEPGELCVKGPQVMRGYWQRPEDTQKSFTDDGFLKTGDVALIQEDGYIRIVDRKKDMIIVSGFNVFPNEIEDVVTSHPKVVECAAVGIPDAKSGEAVKVYVVPTKEGVTANELKEFCRERLTAYKVPKHFEFRDELPKSNVGKILRRELRDEANAK
ncbi:MULTISPECIES: long-chain fatty acid--CoA ligase [Marinobacter]|uniref:long-chain fatty acid--CoA ligase n=1 Tax=Marinobacter TaxID=2742 RepID=UPI000C56B166|nr:MULTISPECIES: long-chain fatty acid--CoA ligase [Marinobacter]MAO12282.1 long-chain fatty acid--CoA ligase [Marinobacter sp.]PSF11274.1 long-chain fatty acid--CoA ligase [Marinobacter shengliensis]QFS86971.1 Long-chain-fatty-acid--CoA ligase [Marinobacter sp. THAF197a]QFT50755.1 Long-chain-fatty-acid--CoA ligase [Marinobacter sp. THAF39]